MEGMIKIIQGKIYLLGASSGHYSPEPMDLYRCIKKLQELMPEVVAPEFNVEVHYGNSPRITMPLQDFVIKMENTNAKGLTLYQMLRDERIQKIKSYTKDLKNAYVIKIYGNVRDLVSSFVHLSSQERKNLMEG